MRTSVLSAALILSCCFVHDLGALQIESGVRRVTVTSVEPQGRKGGGWVVAVQGEWPKLPRGTRVDFDATWNSTLVDSVTVEVQGSSFAEELVLENASVMTADDFQFRTVIRYDSQSASVKKAIDRDDATFSRKGSWVDYHFGQGFVLGDEEERQEARAEVQGFFERHFEKVVALDAAVKERVEKHLGPEDDDGDAPEDGPDGSADGAAAGEDLDPEKWRRWFEEDIVKELVASQKEIEGAFEEIRFRPYRLALSHLQEIVNGVARRTLSSQQKLFRAQGVELTTADRRPEELDVTTRTRRVPTGRYLNDRWTEVAKLVGLSEPREESE